MKIFFVAVFQHSFFVLLYVGTKVSIQMATWHFLWNYKQTKLVNSVISP